LSYQRNSNLHFLDMHKVYGVAIGRQDNWQESNGEKISRVRLGYAGMARIRLRLGSNFAAQSYVTQLARCTDDWQPYPRI